MESSDEEGDLQDAEDFDPTEVFTVDDMLTEDEILEYIVAEEFKADMDGEASTIPHRRRQSGPRRYIPRNREASHDDLVANYFLQILSTPRRCSVGDLGCISLCFYVLCKHLVIGRLISPKESMLLVGVVFHRFKSVLRLSGC
jgi:hypothetical protein